MSARGGNPIVLSRNAIAFGGKAKPFQCNANKSDGREAVYVSNTSKNSSRICNPIRNSAIISFQLHATSKHKLASFLQISNAVNITL